MLISGIINFVENHMTLSLVLLLVFLYLVSEIGPGIGKRLPPGPWQLPVVGSLPFLIRDPDAFTAKMLKKYGDVVRVSLGGIEMVVLGTFKAVNEAFVVKGDVCNGRTQRYFNFFNYVWSNKGILIEDGKPWKEQRRFALSSLRDFGFGRFSMEDKIHMEVNKIREILLATKGAPTQLRELFHKATANAICSITFGKSFDYDDPEFLLMMDTIVDMEKNFEFVLVAFMPWTRHISRALSGMNKLKRFKTNMIKFITKYMDEHKATYDGTFLRDYLDCYLQEMYSRQRKDPKNVGSFDEIRLRSNLSLMFFAGVSTTSNTLNWAFKALVVYPEQQAELHVEIDRVVGADRQVSYADRLQMPLTEAFICEVQRYADVVPFGVAHSNLEPTKLFGYDIPKHTMLLAHQRAVHQDPALWDDPENFRPSRFLNEQGVVVKPEYFIPFGIGKRACMGEVLARTEMFLHVVGLLQIFRFTAPVGEKNDLQPKNVFNRQLPDYKICATPRFS